MDEEEWIVTKLIKGNEERYIAQPEGTNLVTNEVLLVSELSKDEAVSVVNSIGEGTWVKWLHWDIFIHTVYNLGERK